MLSYLVRASLKYPWITCALYGAFVVFALLRVQHAELDVFPDFVPAQVSIQTEAPGFAPDDVESLVSTPIETALSGVGKQEYLRSSSAYGLSVITIVFQEGTDLFQVRQLLAERLTEVSTRLPIGTKSPQMAPLTSSTADLLKVGLVSDSLAPFDLRDFADYVLKPALLSVAGVAKCTVFGGDVRQLQINLDSKRLKLNGISPLDIITNARLATGVRGVGMIKGVSQEIVIKGIGQVQEPEDISQAIINTKLSNGRYAQIGEVSSVKFGSAIKIGDTLIDGKRGILLSLASQFGANTLETTKSVERVLNGMEQTFKNKGITVFKGLHRPATFVERSLTHIKTTLLIGGILVAVVLLLFLGDLRTGLVSLVAIPLSLLGSVVGLQMLGITLNTMSIGGLALAIGEVVDDAIIDVENIHRRLRENSSLNLPSAIHDVVLRASLEIRNSVVFATATVVVVFLPIFGLSGVEGSFFKPLALSYILAILSSLIVAISCTPALMLLTTKYLGHRNKETTSLLRLQTTYGSLLKIFINKSWISAILMVLLLATVWPLLPSSGFTLLPEFQEGHLVIQVRAKPGASLNEMRQVGSRISHELLALPAIATVEEQIGRAELSEDTWGISRAEFHVELKEKYEQDPATVADDVREVLEHYPGLETEVLSFLGDRISETITGETAPLVVRLYGNDLDILDKKAHAIAEKFEQSGNLVDVSVRAQEGMPTLAVRLDFKKLAILGFRAVDVLDTLATTFQGTTVGQFYKGRIRTDIVVLLDRDRKLAPEEIKRIPLQSLTGAWYELGDIADVTMYRGRETIEHEGQRRKQTIVAHFANSNSEISQKIPTIIDSVLADTPDTTYTLLDTNKLATDTSTMIIGQVALVVLVLGLLLKFVLREFSRVALVLVNIPFSCIGGIIAMYFYQLFCGANGAPWTLGTLIGFITLFGMTMRTSIMLLTHYDHLVVESGTKLCHATIVQGATERLIPILMTSIVTGLGLLPIALTPHQAGHEIEGPMAWVIIGGLFTSTVLSLLVLPVMVSLLNSTSKEAPDSSESLSST